MAKPSEVMIRVWRAVICVIGLLSIMSASLLHHHYNPAEFTAFYLGLKFLEALGLALFVMGLLTLVLDLKHWKEYFEHRLSNIVVGQEYLRELSPEALQKHQIKVFQLYYHDEAISDSGFVSYCLNKIHGYVVTPYRSNVHDLITINRDAAGHMRVENNLRYELRKAGGRIQSRIGWQANSQEVLQMNELTLELVSPGEGAGSGQVLKRIDIEGFKREDEPDGSVTYTYDLEPYKDLDGLAVKIKADYYVEPSAFYTWRMIDPSEKVELYIKYPADLKLQFKPFLLEQQPVHQIQDQGFFNINFDSWIMPRSGFVWKLLSADVPARVMTPDKALIDNPAPQPEILINRSAEPAAPAPSGG